MYMRKHVGYFMSFQVMLTYTYDDFSAYWLRWECRWSP